MLLLKKMLLVQFKKKIYFYTENFALINNRTPTDIIRRLAAAHANHRLIHQRKKGPRPNEENCFANIQAAPHVHVQNIRRRNFLLSSRYSRHQGLSIIFFF